jgi:hypothetical protein
MLTQTPISSGKHCQQALVGVLYMLVIADVTPIGPCLALRFFQGKMAYHMLVHMDRHGHRMEGLLNVYLIDSIYELIMMNFTLRLLQAFFQKKFHIYGSQPELQLSQLVDVSCSGLSTNDTPCVCQLSAFCAVDDKGFYWV